MSDSDPKGNTPTVTIAEKVGFLDVELSKKRSSVVRHLLVLQWTVDVGSAAVPLLLDGYYLPSFRKGWQNFFERGFNCSHASMKLTL
jgi:hypothetical protein